MDEVTEKNIGKNMEKNIDSGKWNNKDPFFALKELPSGIDPKILQTKPFKSQLDEIVQIIQPEFTSVCPMTGLPDFGTVKITYIPNDVIIELKSLKYYYMGFRNVGIFYEALASRITEDLFTALKPKVLAVHIVMTPRGGIQSKAYAIKGNIDAAIALKTKFNEMSDK